MKSFKKEYLNEKAYPTDRDAVDSIYSDMALTMKEIRLKAKSISKSLDSVLEGVPSDGRNRIESLNAASGELFEDIERINVVMDTIKATTRSMAEGDR
jgi:hypothetical protein